MIHFGFSYVSLIFLLMLFCPNILWTKHKPAHYEDYVGNERKLFVILERAGEILVCGISLVFSDFNFHAWNIWSLWLALAILCMFLYEGYWIRYFKSKQTMEDFYASFVGMPVAGATYPVLAFFFLGIYGTNIFLIVASIILGIGHIGIHLEHKKEISKN